MSEPNTREEPNVRNGFDGLDGPEPASGLAVVLTELAEAGGAGAQRFPAAAVHARGRTWQRRRRAAVATTGVLACGVAAGMVALVSGGTGPAARPAAPGRGATPAATATTASTRPATVLDQAAFLPAAALPRSGDFGWQRTGAVQRVSDLRVTLPACTDGRVKTLDLPGVTLAGRMDYTSPRAQNVQETVYQFASALQAEQVYPAVQAATDWCGTTPAAQVDVEEYTGQGSGFVLRQGPQTARQQVYVVVSDDRVAVLAFRQTGAPEIAGVDNFPVIDAMTGPSARQTVAGMPAGVWLKPEEFPFATADRSHGWVSMGPPRAGVGHAAPADLCAGVQGGLVDTSRATVAGQTLHGSPDRTPLDPKTGYLYSAANQEVAVYPDAASARTAFAKAKALLAVSSCKVDDGSGKSTRTVTPGLDTADAFSAAVDDHNGSHLHEYVVLKDTHIVEVTVNFVDGPANTDFGSDQPFFYEIRSRLP